MYAREARLLGGADDGLALLIESIASDDAGRPVEYGRTFVRGDRSRAYIERVVVRSPSDEALVG
jgi:DNA-binding GntR family transcriptional regulator